MEAIMAHMVPPKRLTIPSGQEKATANWQNGLESGGHVQRKLRLTFTNGAALQPTN